MNIEKYLAEVQRIHKTGVATEHSYRGAIQSLLSQISDNVTALNEPKRVACGAPDFLINRGNITIGHAEAKDLDKKLAELKGHDADQKLRFLKALSNLIYTNGIDFEFYRNGTLVNSVSIAKYNAGIKPQPENFSALEHQLRDFAAQKPQTITSSQKLAEIMAGKAALIKDILHRTLREDKDQSTELSTQYEAFKEHLIHDISIEDFADIYAETIAYGMFAARLHDTTLDTFSRQEALELLPKSNPFLRSLFGYIAGPDLDDRIKWVIDDLAEVFQACDVKKIMKQFGTLTGRNDPFLHFYETFLAKYNPSKRKARGVWYTPEPVVNFIVRAVDDVLQTEFGLPMGLADTSKVLIDWDTGQRALTKKGKFKKSGKNVIERKEVHRVQILDPATGTGTFLAEAIKQIAPKVKSVAPGMWSNYIEKDLIPRLHGFELLMASYAMCHMKLDMVLSELGYTPSTLPPRLSVYLTNSMEEGEPANQTLPFAQWLSNEVRQANVIKRDMPIMCVIGNPPYSGHSANGGDWIKSLIEPYKQEPQGTSKLKERNGKWLNDDYVKFIRFAENLIEKNTEGVLGFITNHGYLDNPTFRGMRWHLLKTFDKIYIIDLHGNAKKKEISPDGSPDKNVFDIQQGVAIIVAVKKGALTADKPLAKVFHKDLWGERKDKYTKLEAATIADADFVPLQPRHPHFHFARRDYALEDIYLQGFSLTEFFVEGVLGFQTHRDHFAINDNRPAMIKKLRDFLDGSLSDADLHHRYGTRDNRDWKISEQRSRLRSDKHWEEKVTKCLYRPFDIRFCHLDYVTMDYPRTEIIRNLLNKENLCLLASRQLAVEGYRHCLVTNLPPESCVVSLKTKEQNQVFPLYRYPSESELNQTRQVNFDPKLQSKLQTLADHPVYGKPDELAIFDYIYGVLHCASYRETYREFLKADFPRIPWPGSPEEFWTVSRQGGQLRRLHLMEPEAIGDTPFPLSGEGDSKVTTPKFQDGKVWINDTQFFDAVPEAAWTFSIGGYEPAQKWLKDRRGRELTFEDVTHYQRIIKVLLETERLIKSIKLPVQA